MTFQSSLLATMWHHSSPFISFVPHFTLFLEVECNSRQPHVSDSNPHTELCACVYQTHNEITTPQSSIGSAISFCLRKSMIAQNCPPAPGEDFPSNAETQIDINSSNKLRLGFEINHPIHGCWACMASLWSHFFTHWWKRRNRLGRWACWSTFAASWIE